MPELKIYDPSELSTNDVGSIPNAQPLPSRPMAPPSQNWFNKGEALLTTGVRTGVDTLAGQYALAGTKALWPMAARYVPYLSKAAPWPVQLASFALPAAATDWALRKGEASATPGIVTNEANNPWYSAIGGLAGSLGTLAAVRQPGQFVSNWLLKRGSSAPTVVEKATAQGVAQAVQPTPATRESTPAVPVEASPEIEVGPSEPVRNYFQQSRLGVPAVETPSVGVMENEVPLQQPSPVPPSPIQSEGPGEWMGGYQLQRYTGIPQANPNLPIYPPPQIYQPASGRNLLPQPQAIPMLPSVQGIPLPVTTESALVRQMPWQRQNYFQQLAPPPVPMTEAELLGYNTKQLPARIPTILGRKAGVSPAYSRYGIPVPQAFVEQGTPSSYWQNWFTGQE